jgi:hypothetical protein
MTSLLREPGTRAASASICRVVELGVVPSTGCRLVLTHRNVSRVIPLENVVWIASAKNNVCVHLVGEQAYARVTLDTLADALGTAFLRIHREAVVNLACIVEIRTKRSRRDYNLLLRDGTRLVVSRTYAAEFRHVLLPRVSGVAEHVETELEDRTHAANTLRDPLVFAAPPRHSGVPHRVKRAASES